MKKALVPGLVALFMFAVLSVVVAGAPGTGSDPVNGTTDEEGLINSPLPSNNASGDEGSSSNAGDVTGSAVTPAEPVPPSALDEMIEQEKREYEFIKAFLQGKVRCYFAKKWRWW